MNLFKRLDLKGLFFFFISLTGLITALFFAAFILVQSKIESLEKRTQLVVENKENLLKLGEINQKLLQTTLNRAFIDEEFIKSSELQEAFIERYSKLMRARKQNANTSALGRYIQYWEEMKKTQLDARLLRPTIDSVIFVESEVHVRFWKDSVMFDTTVVRPSKQAQKVLNPQLERAVQALVTNLDFLIVSNNEMYRTEELLINRFMGLRKLVIWGWFVAKLILLLVVYLTYKNLMLRQLQRLKEMIDQLRQGNNLPEYEQIPNNEVGAIINLMYDFEEIMLDSVNAVNSMASGDYTATENENAETNSHKLSKAISELRNGLRIISENEKREKWITIGQAKFSEILRIKSDNFSDFAYDIISELVEYTGAAAGGIYVLDENDGNKLYLAASYAYSRRKFIERTLATDDGLVGQCFQEAQPISLTRIPKGYLELRSGLGGDEPQHLLLMPLKHNEQVFGVLEIASFHQLADYKLTFLEKVAELVASELNAVKVAVQTTKLLNESRELGEALRSQEEEMRQNMEELQATQEEMARKENELRLQIDAVGSTMGVAELDANGNFISANPIFLDYFKYDANQLISRHFTTLLDKTERDITQNLKFWNEIIAGVRRYAKVKRFTADGSALYLAITYAPIFSVGNKVERVVVFAQNVTDSELLKIELENERAEKAKWQEQAQNVVTVVDVDQQNQNEILKNKVAQLEQQLSAALDESEEVKMLMQNNQMQRDFYENRIKELEAELLRLRNG